MKMYRSATTLFAVNEKGQVAPAPNDAETRRHCFEPETFLRLAFGMAWVDPQYFAETFTEAVTSRELCWERPDPWYRLYICPNELIVVDRYGDCAVALTLEDNLGIVNAWKDPHEFLILHANGQVSWTSQWTNADQARAHYSSMINNHGQLHWELVT